MEYKKIIDVFCVGETLIDLIGHQMDVPIENTGDYHRCLGGSPTNVAMNLTRLGVNVELAGTIGEDGFGKFILNKLKENRVSTTCVRQDAIQPTSVIFVSKTKETPDFIPFRKADVMITENQIPTEIIKQTRIFHTTAFALSKNPSRNTILAKAKEAHELGCTLSIDINYSPRIWPDRLKAMETIKAYCQYDPLIKISEDDMERLFEEHLSHEEIFTFFHDHLNVSTVCLTLGSKGVTLSRKHETPITLPAEKIKDIMDATGAGDAFWSGFLFAYLKEFPIERSLRIALSLAAIKLQNIGSLPRNRDLLSELLRIK
ncbi:PfkB family carbohydrate kinase [Dokdonia sp.]|uniref:carbohydrate kinase family protein n=1 Tax=Dokdonia sp. TaxID=2024995 RepID=UPI003264C33C